LRTAVVLLGGGVFLVAVFLAVGGLGAEAAMPAFGEPLLAEGGEAAGVSAKYLAQFDRDTGAANCVMGILLDYRAYDTLGEATVIFVAIMGGYVVLRKIGRKRESQEQPA
jgi:multicomponent Na+:H+ antiporter subunit B